MNKRAGGSSTLHGRGRDGNLRISGAENKREIDIFMNVNFSKKLCLFCECLILFLLTAFM